MLPTAFLLQRSWWYLTFILVTHALALGILWLIDLALIAQLGLAILLVVSGYLGVILVLKAPFTLRALGNGEWQVTHFTGTTWFVELRDTSLVTPHLMVLCLKGYGLPWWLKSLVIPKDVLSDNDFKRLYVILKYRLN